MAEREFKLTLLLNAIDRASAPVNRVQAAIARVTKPFTAVSNQLTALGDAAGLDKLTSRFTAVKDAAGDVADAAEKSFGRLLKVAGVAGGGIFLFKREVIDAADQMQKLGISLNALEHDNVGAVKKDFSFIKDISLKSPFSLDTMIGAFRTMKAQGLDPVNGQMQALVDYTAKVGGDSDVLARMSAELGHASAMGKLQAQQMRALAREGIPVYTLLTAAVEKFTKSHAKLTEAQLLEMSKKGLLGKGAVNLLMKEMGDESRGAAEAMATRTFGGQLNRLETQWKFFAQRLMKIDDTGVAQQGGPMDVLLRKFRQLNDWVTRISSDGTLDRWAANFADIFERFFAWLDANGPRILTQIVSNLKAVFAVADKVATAFDGWGNFITFGIAAYIGGPLVASVVSLVAAIASLNVALIGTPAGLLLLGAASVTAAAAGVVYIGYRIATAWSEKQAEAERTAQAESLASIEDHHGRPNTRGLLSRQIADIQRFREGRNADAPPPNSWFAALKDLGSGSTSPEDQRVVASSSHGDDQQRSGWLSAMNDLSGRLGAKKAPVLVGDVSASGQAGPSDSSLALLRSHGPFAPARDVARPASAAAAAKASGPAQRDRADINVTVTGPRGTKAEVARGSTANVSLERHILMGPSLVGAN